MARSIWSGTISFGLIAIPVGSDPPRVHRQQPRFERLPASRGEGPNRTLGVDS
jgi:non-homologous end joining protein Ku